MDAVRRPPLGAALYRRTVGEVDPSRSPNASAARKGSPGLAEEATTGAARIRIWKVELIPSDRKSVTFMETTPLKKEGVCLLEVS